MFSLTIKSIRANKARFLLTGVAVMLGVAFMAGTFVLTDTIKKSYDDIAANVYRSTDAVVRSDRDDQERRARCGHPRHDRCVDPRHRPRRERVCKRPSPSSSASPSWSATTARLLDTNRSRAVPIALAWQDTPALNPLELVSGHAPHAPERDRDRPRFGREGSVRGR